jgi:hypothetical protein
MWWRALRGSPRASRASQGPRPSAVALSGPLVGRSTADAQRWRLQTCSVLLQIGFLKESLSFDAVCAPARHGRRGRRRRGRVVRRGRGRWGPAWGAVSGARRAADVDATRGRRRRRGAQIVSSGAVQGEERERRGELVGKSHLWRSRLPVCYAHRFAPRLLVRSTMGWGCAVRDSRSCSALLRAYLLASLGGD